MQNSNHFWVQSNALLSKQRSSDFSTIHRQTRYSKISIASIAKSQFLLHLLDNVLITSTTHDERKKHLCLVLNDLRSLVSLSIHPNVSFVLDNSNSSATLSNWWNSSTHWKDEMLQHLPQNSSYENTLISLIFTTDLFRLVVDSLNHIYELSSS